MVLTVFYNSNIKYYGYLGRVEEMANESGIVVKKIDVSTVKDVINSFVDSKGKILIAEPLSNLGITHKALAKAIAEKVGKERVIKDDFTAQSIIHILFDTKCLEEKDDYVIIGYGKIGKQVADFLLSRGKVVKIIPSRHSKYSPRDYEDSSVIINTASSVVDDDFYRLGIVIDCGGAFGKRNKPVELLVSRRQVGTRNVEKLIQHIMEG